MLLSTYRYNYQALSCRAFRESRHAFKATAMTKVCSIGTIVLCTAVTLSCSRSTDKIPYCKKHINTSIKLWLSFCQGSIGIVDQGGTSLPLCTPWPSLPRRLESSPSTHRAMNPFQALPDIRDLRDSLGSTERAKTLQLLRLVIYLMPLSPQNLGFQTKDMPLPPISLIHYTAFQGPLLFLHDSPSLHFVFSCTCWNLSFIVNKFPTSSSLFR